jgi:hypothetical protein
MELLELPQSTVIFTNILELMYFFYGRIGLATTVQLDNVKLTQNANYSKRVQEMREQLLAGNSVLVWFPSGCGPTPADWVEGLSFLGERNGVELYASKEMEQEMIR